MPSGARPHRVLHLIKGLGRGGAEVLLAKGLGVADRESFELSFGYFLPHKGHLADELRAQGAEVVCFDAPSPARIALAVPALVQHLRRQGVDLLHCHLNLPAVIGRLAARAAGVPVVYTQHGPMEFSTPLSRRANMWTWGWQQEVIAVSHETAESVARHVGTAVPCQVIENGVSTDHFAADPQRGAELRRRLGIGDDVPVVGTVAVFRRQKRIDLWLETADLIRRQHPGAAFVVVGDGPLAGDLEATVRELGLGASTHFVGLQEDVRPYLDAMDLFLMSSDFEGTPVALLEAMSMGLPVVSTSVGGVPRVAVDGETGLLTEVGDPAALAAAADALLRDRERARRMGAAGRRRIETAYSMSRMQRELEQVYRRILAGNRPAA